MDVWANEFGQAYTDRNTFTQEDMEQLYLRNYGVTRTEMNSRFLSQLDRSIRILSGVLIHLHPTDISKALTEIYRCTKNYIWGFEYYTEIPYREHSSLLWKANFSQEYLNLFEDIRLEKEEYFPYLDSENTDSMFLLKRK